MFSLSGWHGCEQTAEQGLGRTKIADLVLSRAHQGNRLGIIGIEAERLFEQHTAEMSAQRDKLEAALRENQTEMQKALERFGAMLHDRQQVMVSGVPSPRLIYRVDRPEG